MGQGPTEVTFLDALRQGNMLLGVVHLLPLPGSPGYGGNLDTVVERAVRDADSLLEAGFDGYVVENFGDVPFFKDSVPPSVLTAMTRVVLACPREGAWVGINVLRNDVSGALAVASTTGSSFVRANVWTGAAVTDQGIIEGRAAEVIRSRQQLGANHVSILADVDVKHAVPLAAGRPIEELAEEAAHRGLADGLIVTGPGTGKSTSTDDLDRVTRAVTETPVLVGSGVTRHSVQEVLQLAHGVIVGTALKRDERVENAVDPERAKAFVARAREGHAKAT